MLHHAYWLVLVSVDLLILTINHRCAHAATETIAFSQLALFFYYLNRGKGIQRLIFGITSFLFAMRSHFLFQQVMCRLPKSTHPKWIVGHSFSESWLSILFVDWFRYSHDSLFLTFFIGHSSPSMDNPKHQTTN